MSPDQVRWGTLYTGPDTFNQQAVENLPIANENAISIAYKGPDLKNMAMKVPTMDEAIKEHTMYLMTEMGFRPGEGENTWNHCVFEEEIQFDPQTESFTQLVFRIYKAGYKNAKNEIHSEIPG